MSRQESHVAKWLCASVLVLALLVACGAREADPRLGPVATPAAAAATTAATPAAVAAAATATTVPTVAPARATPSPTAPAPTPLATASDAPSHSEVTPSPETANIKACLQLPQRYSIGQDLGILWLAALRFESEDLVTFEGWLPRPEPVPTSVVPTVVAGEGPPPNGSSRILLTGGQVDLLAGQLSLRAFDVGQPITRPCGAPCPLEVIGQSPDGKWQLLQVSDWLSDYMGLWLVSETAMTHVVAYVPAGLRWQWADDSSLLWLTYSDPEIGAYTVVAWLDDEPRIQRVKSGGVLNAYFYFLAYSPVDNTVRSVPSYEWDGGSVDEIYTVSLAAGLEDATATESVPGIVSVSWNEATDRFITQVVTPGGIVFRELTGATVWHIPNETLAMVFPSFTNALDSLPHGISLAGDWAVSDSGNRLALAHNPREIWIFDCEDTN